MPGDIQYKDDFQCDCPSLEMNRGWQYLDLPDSLLSLCMAFYLKVAYSLKGEKNTLGKWSL